MKLAHGETAESGLLFPAAVRSALFWFVAIVFFLAALGTSGLMVHMIPMLTGAGLTPARAGTIAGIMGIAVIAGRVASGALIDRFFAPYVGATLFTVTAVGCVAMVFGGVTLAPVAAFLLGFAMGAEVDFIGYLTARYFGMRSYGSIYGTIYAIFLAGAAFGQLGAGWIFGRLRVRPARLRDRARRQCGARGHAARAVPRASRG